MLFPGSCLQYCSWFSLRVAPFLTGSLFEDSLQTTSPNFLCLSRLETIFGIWLCRLTAMALSSFATTTLLTKNSFLDEIRKQYVQTARAKGLAETKVLYGHVFRNAMLIIIAGFPAAFITSFFHRFPANRNNFLA